MLLNSLHMLLMQSDLHRFPFFIIIGFSKHIAIWKMFSPNFCNHSIQTSHIKYPTTTTTPWRLGITGAKPSCNFWFRICLLKHDVSISGNKIPHSGCSPWHGCRRTSGGNDLGLPAKCSLRLFLRQCHGKSKLVWNSGNSCCCLKHWGPVWGRYKTEMMR